jgi:hypothetical protein
MDSVLDPMGTATASTSSCKIATGFARIITGQPSPAFGHDRLRTGGRMGGGDCGRPPGCILQRNLTRKPMQAESDAGT